ncbi:LysR substrate-binding domain-containing protein [Telmatospirillum sp. J64-1]|uniref:LysR substrate-binding domain-containing protein n=1 Tax=Telmatospirillum sp. J64-1 TaxID=2502183 RepID=UPI001C8F2E18|nr:LysR substrate-binding domain-containing protein [Telmatospirillum sp. J64-1]
MDIRQLRYFIVLAETKHFGQAAERLHMTQPPLSRQIAALEESLGVALFRRTSRSVSLTPAGEDFYRNAKRLLADLDFAVRSARATAQGERGEVRIGFTMYAAWNVLPRLIKAFSEAHPDVSLILNETLPRDLHQALMAGEADIGITIRFPGDFPNVLRYHPLSREPLCAVLPQTHPLAGKESISVGDLAAEPFVTFPRTTAPVLHEAVMSCCRQHGFEPVIRLETHLQQTIVNLVAEGLGVSLVPDSMRRMQLAGAVFRTIEASAQIEQGLYWNDRNANPCLPGFLDTAHRLSEACGLVASGPTP